MATNSQPMYPPWLWGITGLVVGLFIALLLVFSSKDHLVSSSLSNDAHESLDSGIPSSMANSTKPAIEYKFYTPLPEKETLLGKHRAQQILKEQLQVKQQSATDQSHRFIVKTPAVEPSLSNPDAVEPAVTQPVAVQDIIDSYENKDIDSVEEKPYSASAEQSDEIKAQELADQMMSDIESIESVKTSNTSNSIEEFIIQAGSFRSQIEADRQRGQLLLLGFQPSIEQANLNAEGTWYRVIIGPFSERDQAEKVLGQIDQQKFPVRIFRRTDS